MPKQPSYQIFLKCKEYTNDSFWQQQLIECANGKFPRGITYKVVAPGTGILSIRRNSNAPTIYNISDTDEPEKVFSLIQNVFRSIGITSHTDNENVKAEIEKIKEKTDCDMSWKQIRQKKARFIMIVNYTMALSKKYNLNHAETMQLYKTICDGITFHAILSDDIIVKKNNIIRIKTLARNQSGEFYCTRDFKDDTSTVNKEEITYIKDLYDKCKDCLVKQHIKFSPLTKQIMNDII